MQIFFTNKAAEKIRNLIGEKPLQVLVHGSECASCSGGGIQLQLIHKDALPVDRVVGISNGITWVCKKNETSFLDGSEIDIKKDNIGEYIEIFNLGHFIPFPIEQLTLSPVM